MCPLTPGKRCLASLFGSLATFGCGRDGGHAQASPAPSSSHERDAQAGSACHAGWPMPNLAASGLPHPEDYDTSDPDVTRDRVTGLSWQRALDANSYNFWRANDYCGALALGGHRDWRVPTLIELVSIADTSRTDAAADPVAFANTPAALFWSSQTDITNTGLGWYVSFKTGAAYVGNDVVRLARVRCVRGASSCTDSDASAYTVAADTAHDNRTGLTWRRPLEHDNYAWKDAKHFCAGLEANGGGWRLPSLRELLTVVDLKRVEPAIDSAAFPDTPSELFWSSSPSGAPAGTAWGVNFTRGSSGAALVGTTAHVRCAR